MGSEHLAGTQFFPGPSPMNTPRDAPEILAAYEQLLDARNIPAKAPP